MEAAGVQAPRFEVDPMWPKPLPNHWVIGQTIGVSVDAQDHIWIIHRAGLARSRRRVTPTTNPPDRAVLRCRRRRSSNSIEAGNLIGHWGGPGQGYDWPDSNHGITVDYKGNVWIGGNGRGAQPGAAQAGATMSEIGRGGSRINDNMVLKFTQDGKFLMQIGKPGQSKGSNDIENLRLPAKTFVDPKTNEAVRRRRLRQPSRDRVRRRHRQVQAALGRLRQQAGRHRSRALQSERRRPRSSSAIRCTAPSSRSIGCSTSATASTTASRCSRPDGTFVKEAFIEKNTLGDGSVWDIAFSKDPQQKYIYLADGENEQVHILLRDTLEVLTSFGDGGRQPGRILRRAQHRHRFQGQHLHHRNLSRPARAEVRLQGPGAGHEEGPGRGLAESAEELALS